MKNKFFLKFGLVAATLWVFSATAHAQQVRSIVTSFPRDLTAVCKKAFEAKNPGVKVKVLAKDGLLAKYDGKAAVPGFTGG